MLQISKNNSRRFPLSWQTKAMGLLVLVSAIGLLSRFVIKAGSRHDLLEHFCAGLGVPILIALCFSAAAKKKQRQVYTTPFIPICFGVGISVVGEVFWESIEAAQRQDYLFQWDQLASSTLGQALCMFLLLSRANFWRLSEAKKGNRE